MNVRVDEILKLVALIFDNKRLNNTSYLKVLSDYIKTFYKDIIF